MSMSDMTPSSDSTNSCRMAADEKVGLTAQFERLDRARRRSRVASGLASR